MSGIFYLSINVVWSRPRLLQQLDPGGSACLFVGDGVARTRSGGDRRGRDVARRRPHQGLAPFAPELRERAVIVAAEADLGSGPGAMGRHIDHVASSAADEDHIPDVAVVVGDRGPALERLPVCQSNWTIGEFHCVLIVELNCSSH